MTATNLTLRDATEMDGDAINALFQRVFDKRRPLETWNWLFHQTPTGPGHAVLAFDASKLVAHAGTITRALSVGGSIIQCGQSIDAMTDPDYQRQGINQRLNQALSALHEKEEVEVVYGFSNKNSTDTVLRHQGRVPLVPFPVLIRPLRWLRMPLRMALRKERLWKMPPISIPSDVDALWAASQHRDRVSIVRDAAYFRWRYARPGGAYRIVEVRRGGTLEGLGVLGFRTQMGMAAAFVTDVMVHEDNPAGWRAIIEELLAAAREEDCDIVSALAFPETPMRAAYTRERFIPLPPRLNPEKIIFSVRQNRGNTEDTPIATPSNWDLCWAEHDLT